MEQRKRPILNPIELLKDMGWFSRFCLIGAILMLIDSLFELYTSQFGYLILLFSIIIIIIAPQITDDNPHAVFFAIIVLVLNFFNQIQFHQIIGLSWTTGLGYIGSILVSIGASLAIFLIIVSVAASINRDPIRDIYLFFIGYGLFGLHLLVYLFFTDMTLTTMTMLTIFYFSIMSLFIVLMFLGQKLAGGFGIWLITIINYIAGLLRSPIATIITGFGAGMLIIGNIAFFYFINELGYTLSKTES